MDETALELRRRLEEIAGAVRRTLTGRRPWRLLALGSGATGEVTLEAGPDGLRWVSDLELYLESPGEELAPDLGACRLALRRFDGPAVDLSGNAPATVAGFAPRLWLHDAALVAVRIDGQDDGWDEPFARFRSCLPGREDALELLANRCGEAIDPQADPAYVRAKLALSLGAALLIREGRYAPSYGARRLHLESLHGNPALPEALRPAVEAALLASAWKLGNRPEDREAFLAHPATSLAALRRSLRAVVARVEEGRPEGAAPAFAHPPLKTLIKDWLRVLRHPDALRGALGFPLTRGPRRSSQQEVLDGMIRDLRGKELQRRHHNWMLYAKGT